MINEWKDKRKSEIKEKKEVKPAKEQSNKDTSKKKNLLEIELENKKKYELKKWKENRNSNKVLNEKVSSPKTKRKTYIYTKEERKVIKKQIALYKNRSFIKIKKCLDSLFIRFRVVASGRSCHSYHSPFKILQPPHTLSLPPDKSTQYSFYIFLSYVGYIFAQ